MEETDYEICDTLSKFYDDSEGRIKTDAMVCRAYVDKISQVTITGKVDAELNSIKSSIRDINPKFKETSKNYEEIKAMVLDTISNYEQVLVELGEFYDGKIEQLILRKVELESSLVASYVNEEYFHRKINKRIYQKDHDKVHATLQDNIKAIHEKYSFKKNESNLVDTKDIYKMIDSQDVMQYVKDNNEKKIQSAQNEKILNKDEIQKIEKEISLTNGEIQRLNEQKRKFIIEAMEVGEKTLMKSIKRPKVFNKLTKFFVCRFNTLKIIESTVINPLNTRINNFRVNELISIKG